MLVVKFEIVEYLKVVSDMIKRRKPNKNVKLVWTLYPELFFGNKIKKLQIRAIIGI